MRALLAVTLGIAGALGVGLLAWRATSTAPPKAGRSGSVPAREPDPTSARRLPFPRSDHEKQREHYRRSRAPFMDALERESRPVGAAVGVEEDLAELVVTLPPTAVDRVSGLRDRAIELGAAQNGFNRIRFVVADPDQRGRPPVLVAEVTLNADNRWVTFVR